MYKRPPPSVTLNCFSAAYRLGDLSLSLSWHQLFGGNYKSRYAYIRSRYVTKYIETRSGYYSNMLYLGITWNLSYGRRK